MVGRWLLLLVLSASACYRYTPIRGVETDAGRSVRVRLTDRGSVDLAPLIGPTIVSLDGTMVTAKDTSMLLSVTNAIARNGVETSWKGERVEIPRSSIAGVEQRELDRRRSWLAGAGGVAGAIAIGAAFNLLGGSFGGKNGPVGGGPR